APHVERIDALDSSRAMIERARTMPGGDHPAIHWIAERAEEAPFDGPYCLAVAGASLHWMDWQIVLPRLARNLNRGAVLAIVVATEEPPPWADQLRELISRYSVIQNWENADLIALLESRGLYQHIAKTKLPAEPFPRTTDEYIDAQHATSGLPRERMGQDRARAFDCEVRELISPYARGEVLQLAASAEVEVGYPLVA
ncbi:MAG: class I SAM-dependent methyltransferase, partial [Chloroflexota bacterium]|nr:class I SAM-dependent methyltransferase [Chloroflexota bacterium]